MIHIRLRVDEILKEQKHSKYWLANQVDMAGKSVNRMVDNLSIGIRYETLEKLCEALNVSVADLFEQTEEPD